MPIRLAATNRATFDFAAEQTTRARTDQGREQGRAPVAQYVAEQTASRGTHDQTRGSIRTAAIVPTVRPAIDAVVSGQPALTIIATIPVIPVGVIGLSAILGPVPIVVAIATPVACVLAQFPLGLAHVAALCADVAAIG